MLRRSASTAKHGILAVSQTPHLIKHYIFRAKIGRSFTPPQQTTAFSLPIHLALEQAKRCRRSGAG
jgi:hypothetical protein